MADPPQDTGGRNVLDTLLAELLRRTHLSAPSDVPALIAEQAQAVGARDVTLHLADLELAELVPLVAPPDRPAEPLSVAGTVAGRAFSSSTIVDTADEAAGGRRLWFPLLDGTERLGVLGVTFDDDRVDDALVEAFERFAHLAAMTIVTKRAYGDAFDVARRRRPVTLATELAWSLAPPLVFATDRLVLAGMLEPAYDNGGDALDYAVDDGVLHVAVFDAMGHGLTAAGVAAFAIAAYRHSRRAGLVLEDTYAAMDEAVAQQFPDERFVTAVIAQLDLDAGELRWVSAGHPPPIVLRDGRRVRTLSSPPALPLGAGLSTGAATASQERLEPGDLLILYSDGLLEARSPDGTQLGLDGLTSFVEREAAAGHPAPETLRRLRQAVVAHHGVGLGDDATAVLVEWRRGSEARLVPPTVLR